MEKSGACRSWRQILVLTKTHLGLTSISYGAFTVSQSQVEPVRNYIRNQEKHHSKISFEEEFKALLRSHGIDFEEQYLWG